MSRYTEMQAGDMLAAIGADASKWADAFAEVHPEIDKGLMIGWFANAIENCWDTRNSAIAQDVGLLITHIEGLLRNHNNWAAAHVPTSVAKC